MRYCNRLLTLSTLLLFVLLVGCTAARYSKAQKAFSRGAALRNLEQIGVLFSGSGVDLADLYGSTTTTEVAAGDAVAQFQLARGTLTKSLKNKRKLRENGLLANAYVLLALTEMELDNPELSKQWAAAARTIFEEDASAGIEDGGRDLALSFAVDPMITFDELYDSISLLTQLPVVAAEDSSATTLLIADFFDRRINAEANNAQEGALRATDFAISKVDNTRETIQYLRNYQMASLLNNRALLDKFLVAGQQSGTFRREGPNLQDQFFFAENRLDELIEDYRLKLLEVSPQGTADPYYRFWKGRVF